MRDVPRNVRAVVVGAGPSGSAAAMMLAASTRCECVLLERKQLPRTKACGGGLSPWTLKFLDRLGVGEPVRRRAFRIDGAIISGAAGQGVELRGDHETAVLLRSDFDALLAREAERRGARLHEGCTVRRIDRHRQQMALETNQGTFEADVVIDCSGATGGFERQGGPESSGRQRVGASRFRRRTLHTIMAWYEGLQGCSDVVELFFDRELRPHYGWVFPESPQRVNVGLCFLPDKTKLNARQRFEAFLERRLATRLAGAQQLGKWIGHPVRVSSMPRRLAAPGILRAGEAGWLADCATAEGIYHALVSGALAGEHVAQLAGRGWRDDLEAGRYQAKVRQALLARMFGGRLLMSALQGPWLDTALKLRGPRATQEVLKKAFAGMYHG